MLLRMNTKKEIKASIKENIVKEKFMAVSISLASYSY